MKASVWWNNEEALARECEVLGNQNGFLRVRTKDPEGLFVESLVHPSLVHTDPEIPEVTLCYGWNGDERPEKCVVGYAANERGILDVRDETSSSELEYHFDHIEPIELAKPIEWELIDPSVERLAEMKSGRVEPCWTRIGVGDAWGTHGDRIVAIHRRPQS